MVKYDAESSKSNPRIIYLINMRLYAGNIVVLTDKSAELKDL